MNPYATFITIYGLVVIGKRLFTYFTWKICCPLVSEIQVFNERQELIKLRLCVLSQFVIKLSQFVITVAL